MHKQSIVGQIHERAWSFCLACKEPVALLEAVWAMSSATKAVCIKKRLRWFKRFQKVWLCGFPVWAAHRSTAKGAKAATCSNIYGIIQPASAYNWSPLVWLWIDCKSWEVLDPSAGSCRSLSNGNGMEWSKPNEVKELTNGETMHTPLVQHGSLLDLIAWL